MIEFAELRLTDFPAFAPFGEIAERTETEIILQGGAAFRATLFAAYKERLDFDLFDVAPFNSDIDLDHTGPREKTAKIKQLIQDLVPFASWCRWSVNDKDRAAEACAQREISTDVPLRRIRLSTSARADIPAGALSDIVAKRVSFTRNAKFGQEIPGTRPDIELFGLMMALNTWAEAMEIAGGHIDFDGGAAHAWLREGLDQRSTTLLKRPGLAARFWHLLSLRLARCGYDDFNRRLMQIGLPIFSRLASPTFPLIDQAHAISVSRITSGEKFRAAQLRPDITTGEKAAEAFADIIKDAARSAGISEDDLPRDPIELIDPSLELVGVIPNLRLLTDAPGHDGSSDDDAFRSGADEEFVQFAWGIPRGAKIGAQALTGQMFILGGSDPGAAMALPVVGGTFGEARAWLRVRIDGLIEGDKSRVASKAVLLVFQTRRVEAKEAERSPVAKRRDLPDEVSRSGHAEARQEAMRTMFARRLTSS